MQRFRFFVALTLVAVGTQIVSAQEAPMTPAMLSFFNPAQVPSEDYDVGGLRIGILYGKCRNLSGLDFGFVNHATGKETGLSIALVNYAEKGFTGLQLGGVNIGGRVNALQIGLYNSAEDMSGIQIGLINHTRLMRGLQVGAINVIENNDLQFLPIINFFF